MSIYKLIYVPYCLKFLLPWRRGLRGGGITGCNSILFTLTPALSHQGRGRFLTFYEFIIVDNESKLIFAHGNNIK
jgi:hypothetical protein